MKNDKGINYELPLHKIDHLKLQLQKTIQGMEPKVGCNIQKYYDKLDVALGKIGGETEAQKHEIKTDDKLTIETKNLIQKRNALRGKPKSSLNFREKIELIELRKTVKKMIREDIRKYDTERILDIMRESNSLKKVKKELFPNRGLISKMTNKKGKIIYNRRKIVKIATDFYVQVSSQKSGP